jgi:hypothetical protein
MSDDLWLRELAQVDREKQAEDRHLLDERWDRLASGELSPDEEAELRALAATSAEARAAYEAFRPLGPDFQASVVRAIREQGFAPPAEAAPVKPPARLLPFRRRAVHFAGWAAVAASAAAAMMVLLVRSPAPLPEYGSPTVAGVQTMRGEEPDPAKVPVLVPGAFHVVLTPDVETSGKGLEARCILVRGQDLRPLEVSSQIDQHKGAVRMEGSIARDIPPGTWTLWAIVGRRGKLPDPTDLQQRSARAKVVQRDWVAVPKEIRIIQPRDLPP